MKGVKFGDISIATPPGKKNLVLRHQNHPALVYVFPKGFHAQSYSPLLPEVVHLTGFDVYRAKEKKLVASGETLILETSGDVVKGFSEVPDWTPPAFIPLILSDGLVFNFMRTWKITPVCFTSRLIPTEWS